MEILGIKFAPLNVPLKRRLETFALLIWTIALFLGLVWAYPIICCALIYSSTFRYFMLPYLLWTYYDWDTRNKGGRSMKWVRLFRRSAWMRYISNYFPIKLVKTVDLDPNRNYLFVYFPHGVLATGIFGAFVCEYSGQKELFPGLEFRPVTLDLNFKTPFFRDLIHIMGFVSSNEESLNYQLSTRPDSPYTGKATILIAGGSAEVYECRPNIYRILVKRRKGFVRLALMHGVPLVPVFAFGETNTYDQVYGPRGSLWRAIQEYTRNVFTLPLVILKGRGVFQYSFGVMCRRTPVTVVVGKPVEVPKIREPTKEQINEYHEKYIEELVKLFESNKHKYHENADSIELELLS